MKRTVSNEYGCLGLLLLVLTAIIVFGIVSAFWGWLFMVIVGACGWHIPFLPVGWAIGAGIVMLTGGVSIA